MATQPIGTLYLLPAPLGEQALHSLPAQAISLMHRLDHFITERGKTTRQLLKATGLPRPLQELQYYELHKRVGIQDLKEYLQPLLQGEDMALMSEAGCPGVADPGMRLVRMAHELGIPVRPITGPSSILLALMASGLSGQSFCFHGYLSAKRDQLCIQLQQLERAARQRKQTQLFMEAPYRNGQVIEAVWSHLRDDTLFCIASMLTTQEEYVMTRSMAEWKRLPKPELHKKPSIFLIGI